LILPAQPAGGAGRNFGKNSLRLRRGFGGQVGRGKKEKGFREREFLPRPRFRRFFFRRRNFSCQRSWRVPPKFVFILSK